MHRRSAVVSLVVLTACATLPPTADPYSDAPEGHVAAFASFTNVTNYEEALRAWHSAEDVIAWIGARFEYDSARALLLSETQRTQSGRLPVYQPAAFFTVPSGVCVDLSRFAVETLQAIEPNLKPSYLMIEFAPVSIAGNTLRRHWMAAFERDGGRYFFADSKRPGYLAGPYESTRAFIEEYAQYRGREVVTFREMGSFEREAHRLATKKVRKELPGLFNKDRHR